MYGFFQSSILPLTEAEASGAVSTSSSTFAVITTMTLTPAAGTYVALFTASTQLGNNDEGEIAFFVGASQQSGTERTVSLPSGGTGEWPCALHSVFTVDGTQAIDVRHRAVTGTLTSNERRLTLIRTAL